MREIKFRVWDKEKRKMFYIPDKDDFLEEGYAINTNGEAFNYVDMQYHPGFIWNIKVIKMQYTGLKDKSDKEIYEGDIVKGFGKLFIVKFGIIEREVVSDNGDINMVQIPSFYFECEGQALYPITNNYKGESDLETLEVIGNIYEDKNLLN